MPRVGVIARADLTGLGVQSRNWVRLLKPDKVIVINSAPFNNNEQHLEWYKDNMSYMVNGFIRPDEINNILDNIDVLLTFEIPYNYELIHRARVRGIKTIIQNNWEFTDYLQRPNLPLPDLLVNQSYWHIDDQIGLWPEITEYCATPVFLADYDSIVLQNTDKDLKKRRFLHVAGRKTYKDRNGTEDLIKAVSLVPEDIDFELVIKTQTTDVPEYHDKRITIDKTVPTDEKELYRGFDAMIMPRRYGGACLPMAEALAAGLPVVMTNIDPNNIVLPGRWLVDASKVDSFMARVNIDVFSADHEKLAEKIAEFAKSNDENILADKILAREIAAREYSSETIMEKWALLLGKIGL